MQIVQGIGGSFHAVKDKRVQFAYNALDQFTFISRYENLDGTSTGLRSVYNYDEAHRLTGLTHRNIPTSGGLTDLATYAFQYDRMNRITSLTHTGPAGGVSDGTSTFNYDLTSQLTGADHAPARPDEAYQYDLNGNRNSAGYTTGTNNQTTSDGTYSYQYDKEGNRTRRTKLSDNSYEEYSWDHRNRLTTVTKRNAAATVLQTVDYSYDIFNRLIKRSHDSNGPTSGGVLDTFFAGFDGINPTLELSKADPGSGGVATTNLKHRYLWGPVVDQLFADEQLTNVTTPGNTLWPVGDHLGTLRDIVDFNSGTTTFTVTNHRTFDSFGRLTAESNATIDLAFAYTGKYFDEASGLSNHWNRWFDPQLGKWISEDPIGFAAGDTNLGRYVDNQVTRFIDPDGLDLVIPPSIFTDKDAGASVFDILGPYTLEEQLADNRRHEAIANAKRELDEILNAPNPDASFWFGYWAAWRGEMPSVDFGDDALYYSQRGGVVVGAGGLLIAGGIEAAAAGGIWGLGGYIAMEAAEEATGIPIIPDPGDLVQAGVRSLRRNGVDAPKSPVIDGNELGGKTRQEIRDLAENKGLKPVGDLKHPDYPRKWKDTITSEERLRLDRGHVDPKTGEPYDNLNAAVDHVHGYTPDGKKIKVDGDPHIPTRGE